MTASSNNASTIYVAESTLGTTPTDSTAWKTFPVAGASGLTMRNITTQSTRVRADRGRSGLIKTGEEIGGPLPTEFQADQHDDLIESALMSAFSTGVLTNGSTRTSYTFQENFGDLTNKYEIYKGVRVNGFNLSAEIDGKADMTFNLIGITHDSDDTASLVGSGSVAAVSTNPVMSIIDLGNVLIDGISGLCLESVNLEVTNNAQAKRCANGSDSGTVDVIEGSFFVSGTVVVGLDDNSYALLARKKSNTAVGISFDLGDGTTTYNFNIHEAYMNFDEPTNQGQDSLIMLNIDFEAAQNDAATATLTITKS